MLDKLDDLGDAAKAADKLEDISDGTKLLPPPKELGDVVHWDGVIRSTDEIFDPSKYKMLDGEKLGDFGESVVEGMLRKKEFGDYDTFYAVQNKSGNGVDIVATNKKGDVYIAEVKSTQQDKLWNNGNPRDIGLKGDQKTMGGKEYSEDRLDRAAQGDDGYTDGTSTEEAIKAQEAIENAKANGNKIEHKKIDVHVDNDGNLRDTPKVKDWKKPPKKKGK
ncbi:hypothetical protein [Zobellia laminariae]|uniref:hypothetical protein n=1 Tax=Zobellia laminariae TaxID=248906 RepID=UPI0026F45AD4|nr:hypothetical protein [Zobellia laminariae]WKX76199.1 hypothetical protein Q5W13_21950 [Zobellia laminariae]